MKQFIFICILSLTVLAAFAQKWEHTFGDPYVEETSNRVIEHYDNGYIITAHLSAGVNDHHSWIIKIDINGNMLWDRVIGVSPDQMIFTKTVVDNQGNLYIFGSLRGNLIQDYPVVVKLNACGEKQWCKLFEFTEYEYGFFTDGIILENGNLLGVAYLPDEEQHEIIYLFCISPDGDYLWKKSYASCDNYPFFEGRIGSRIQFFDDIYIISGHVYSPHPNFPTISSLRPMFIGIDTLFNEQWVLEFGLEDNMKGKALTSIPINDSLFMGVGRYRYYDSTGMTKDAWAMYYNDKGEQTGYQRITRDKLGPEVRESTFFEIERVNDSLFLATTGFIFWDGISGNLGEIVFDTAGKVHNYAIRENMLGTNYITKTFDNKYVIACSSRFASGEWDVCLYKINQDLEYDTLYPGNYTYDSLCRNVPIQSGVIDLVDCDIVTSLKEIPNLEAYTKQKNSIQVMAHPNPVMDGEVRLEFQNTGLHHNMKLECFDVFGTKVHQEKVYPYQGETKINTLHWQHGVFVAIIYSNGTIAGKTKFIVE